MTLDVGTRALLGQMHGANRKAIHECTPDEAREMSRAMAELAGPAPAMARAEDHDVPVNGGSIPVRVLVPQQGARGVIVYLHGGGFVIGSIEQYDAAARKLAERTSCALVVPDYRLAPEHRYPTAVDDSYAALEWTASRLGDITGREDAPLIVAGDSAGGNLAAVIALRARDNHGPEIALQILVYPVTDADLDRPSYLEPDNQLLLTRDSMKWFWDHYVPDPDRRSEPDVSPLRAASLAGLPPAVVMTAEHDVLRDEGEAYADRLRDSGVPVDFKRYDGQMHGFFTMLVLPGGERAFQQFVTAARACVVHHAQARAAT
jgi:acetyl esterase